MLCPRLTLGAFFVRLRLPRLRAPAMLLTRNAWGIRAHT
jgi:hypothetical protein